MIMKKLFILLILFAVYSCVKDAKHQLSEADYDVMLLSSDIQIDDTGMIFQGMVRNQNKGEIIDHGFIWGTRRTNVWGGISEEDFEKWLNESSNIDLRTYLQKYGNHISLGKMENPQLFCHEQRTDIAPEKKYLVVTYIKTKDYTLYTKVKIAKGIGSLPPIIERIDPSVISCYVDQITIYGKNFCSDVRDAKIDKWNYHIEGISPTEIKLIPLNIEIGTNTFLLSIFNKSIPVTFEAIGLVVESIDPQATEVNSIVTIRGKRLSNIRYIYHAEPYYLVEIVWKSDSEVRLKVPPVEVGPTILYIVDTRWNEFLLPIEILGPL